MANEVKKITGKDLFDLLNKHVNEKYVYGASVPKDDSSWKGPWDCAELVSWGIFQLLKLLRGVIDESIAPSRADAYTGSFKSELAQFKQISILEASNTIGAILLRFPGGLTGGHIVVSDGKGGTVEAYSTQMGVINNHISGRRWDVGLLLPEVDYSKSEQETKVDPPKTIIYRYISPNEMMASPLILEIKKGLVAHGYNLDYPLSALYDYQTSVAVRNLQIKEKILVDGEVGPQTAKLLNISL